MQNDVQFEEYRTQISYAGPPTPKIITWVMRISGGTIRDEKTATSAVIVFVLLLILASVFILSSTNSSFTEFDPNHSPRADQK